MCAHGWSSLSKRQLLAKVQNEQRSKHKSVCKAARYLATLNHEPDATGPRLAWATGRHSGYVGGARWCG